MFAVVIIIVVVNNKSENMCDLFSSIQKTVNPQSTGRVAGEERRCPFVEKREREEGRNACQKLVWGKAVLTSRGSMIHSGSE